MPNRLHQLLDKWLQQKDTLQWALATIIETDGSSYRKPGAMMMISSMGQYYGLLSGGCLESDIMRQARKCWDAGENRIIQYDMREEEDLAWQLGIGCGGMVKILLQPVGVDNAYLDLVKLSQCIQQNCTVIYQQRVNEATPVNQTIITEQEPDKAKLIDVDGQLIFQSYVTPPLHLMVFGGGVDAVPVVAMAGQLGWQVSLFDPRASYARAAQFPAANQIIKQDITELSGQSTELSCDAIVIMMHNLGLDAQALQLAVNTNCKYIGMLGPRHRTERVLAQAKMQLHDISVPFANPVGLSIGGELPESIALSILAEIHAFFEAASARSISNLL